MLTSVYLKTKRKKFLLILINNSKSCRKLHTLSCCTVSIKVCLLSVNRVGYSIPFRFVNESAIIPSAKNIVALTKPIAPVIPPNQVVIYQPQRALEASRQYSKRPQDYHMSYGIFAYQTLLAQKAISLIPQKEKYVPPTSIKLQISKSVMHVIQSMTPDINQCINIAQVIQHHIEYKTNIPNNYLDTLLRQLVQQQKENPLNMEQQHILFLLRYYFEDHLLTLENAELFLTIWKKGDHEFKPLRYVFNHDIIQSEISSLEKSLSPIIPSDKKSHTLMKTECFEKALVITKKIEKLFLEYENSPQKILESTTVQEWYLYLEERGSVIPLTPEEINIYNKFKMLQETYAPSKNILLSNIKDKYELWKKHTKLPASLQEEAPDKCFLPEDYEIQIKNINDSLMLLQNDKNLSINDLRMLSINSGAATLDEEGNFKITSHTFASLKNHKETLGLKYTKEFPKKDFIMSQLKNKDFYILKKIPPTRDSVAPVSHLSHNTLVVRDHLQGEDILIRIGMSTSTKDQNTIQLDTCQPTNQEKDKVDKNQRFRTFSHFIPIAKEEPINVDLEMTLYFYGNNSQGESIIEKLMGEYKLRADIWSNNPFQFTYTADYEFIRKLSIIFFESKLQALEQEANELQGHFKGLSKIEFNKKIKKLTDKKNNYMEYKKDQQYFSKLSTAWQDLYRSLKLFEIKLEQDKIRQEKKKSKQEMISLTEKFNSEQNKKIETNAIITAKQKKEMYLKTKELEKHDKNPFNE